MAATDKSPQNYAIVPAGDFALTLKAGFRDLVRAAGGQERAALITGTSQSRVSENASAHCPDCTPRVHHVAILEADARLPVITNPPFNLAVEFALRAIAEAKDGVALLVRSAWAEGGERYRELFKPHPPTQIVHYCDRVPMVKGKYDPKASTATSYSWFIWERDQDRRPCAWIEPGAKERNLRIEDVRRFAA